MESSSAEKADEDVNYGLGLNEDSDRVLRLEIERQESVAGLEVKNLNVSSLRLSGSSPFFDRLFNNGMKESHNKTEFKMIIDESEEAGFMDMFKFAYNKPLTASSRDELLEVLMVADKYIVTSCATQCHNMLREMHMDVKSALYYLDLSAPAFAPLVVSAVKSLCSHFYGFNKLQQEDALSLPLHKLEANFESEDFQVHSEDDLLDFMVEWARKNYGDDQLEERRDILTNRLLGYVCFPCLTPLKLKKMVDYSDFDTERVLKLAVNALFCKVDFPLPNYIPEINEDVLQMCSFPSRMYSSYRTVFFDIKRQDCIDMIPDVSRFYSDAFYLAGKRFSLFAVHRRIPPHDSLELFVEMGSLGSCNLKVKFYALKKPDCQFERLYSDEHATFTGTGKYWWWIQDMFNMRWPHLMRDDSVYMIDGVIHICAKLTFNG